MMPQQMMPQQEMMPQQQGPPQEEMMQQQQGPPQVYTQQQFEPYITVPLLQCRAQSLHTRQRALADILMIARVMAASLNDVSLKPCDDDASL